MAEYNLELKNVKYPNIINKVKEVRRKLNAEAKAKAKAKAETEAKTNIKENTATSK